MALTLAESAKLATDMMLAGVIETIIKEEHVLDQLPFVEVIGNNFVYNRLNTEPTISFFNVGDSWTESTPDFTQISVQLKILGGDADVDNFIQASRANVQDIASAVIQQKAKALARKWADTSSTATRPWTRSRSTASTRSAVLCRLGRPCRWARTARRSRWRSWTSSSTR